MRLQSVLPFLLLIACQDNSLGVYNTPPSAAILSPVGGEQYAPGDLIELRGVVKDSQDASTDLLLSWSSSMDGVLGEDPADANGDAYLAVSELSSGIQVITLTVIDSNGESASAAVDFSVDYGASSEGAPTVILIGPADGAELSAADEITVVGTATDDEQTWDSLEVTVSSSLDGNIWVGNPESNGTVSVAGLDLSVGTHTLRLTAEDEDGHTAYDESTFTVLEDGRPTANIVEPVKGTYFNTDTLNLEGVVSDTETDAEDLLVTWSSDVDGVLLSGAPDSSGYTAGGVHLSDGTHLLTLSVVDGEAKEGTDSVLVTVVDPLDWDDDGDGWTENQGDCDDDDATVSPGEAEICDDVDNNCDGYVNEDWWDAQEENDTAATAYDLGEISNEFWVSGTGSATFTLHSEDDVDYFAFQAFDLIIFDNVELDITVTGLPAAGNFVATLYENDGGSWSNAASTSGSAKLLLSHSGDLWSSEDDNWLLVISSSSWPANSCSSTYTVTISAH